MASIPIDYSKLEPSVAHKIMIAKQKKDAGDQAFKAGQLQPGKFSELFIMVKDN